MYGCPLHPIAHAGGVDALAFIREVFGRHNSLLWPWVAEREAGRVRSHAFLPLHERSRRVLDHLDISILPAHTACFDVQARVQKAWPSSAL